MQRTSIRAGSLFEALGGVSNFSVNSGSSSVRALSGGVLDEAFDKSRDKEKAELEKAGYTPDAAGGGFAHPSGARASATGNHTVVTNADGKASINLGRGKLTDFRKALKDATKNKLVDDLSGRIGKLAQLVNSASGEVLGLDTDPRLTPAQATAAGSLDAALRAAVSAVTPLYSRVLRESTEGAGEFAGWIAIFNGKRLEITKDEAKDIYGAKQLAIGKLKVPKSKQGLLAIQPAYNEAAPSRSAVRSLLNDELIPVQTVHEFVDVVVANYGSKATLREALAELSSMMGRIEAEAEGLLKDNWDALRAEVVKA